MIRGVEKGLPGIREYFLENPRDVKGYISTHSYADTIIVEYLQKNRLDLAYKNVTEKRPKAEPIKESFNHRAIFVTFPTKDLYFPLLPTSVYGSKVVPATIGIIGHVSPNVFQDIKSYTKIKYYISDHTNFVEDLKNFYGEENSKYTKIEINAPSKFLTDDLWINRQAPIKTYYSTFLAKYPFIGAIIFLILSSLIAGLLASSFVFREFRNNVVKFGLISLSNVLSIFGLLIAILLIKIENKNEEKGYIWKRKVAFILLFSISFLIISWLLVKLVEYTV
jgi:hypothetical protein